MQATTEESKRYLQDSLSSRNNDKVLIIIYQNSGLLV